jgi:hypothetical protein
VPPREFALLQLQLRCLASDFSSLAWTALSAHLISSAACVCRVSRARPAQIFVPASCVQAVIFPDLLIMLAGCSRVFELPDQKA